VLFKNNLCGMQASHYGLVQVASDFSKKRIDFIFTNSVHQDLTCLAASQFMLILVRLHNVSRRYAKLPAEIIGLYLVITLTANCRLLLNRLLVCGIDVV